MKKTITRPENPAQATWRRLDEFVPAPESGMIIAIGSHGSLYRWYIGEFLKDLEENNFVARSVQLWIYDPVNL